MSEENWRFVWVIVCDMADVEELNVVAVLGEQRDRFDFEIAGDGLAQLGNVVLID